MDVLDEAKEIMKKAGCEKAFATYKLELYDIAEVKNCSKFQIKFFFSVPLPF